MLTNGTATAAEVRWYPVTESIHMDTSVNDECRLCGAKGLATVVDLGTSPPCERILSAEQLAEPETNYPLCLKVCSRCWLVQLPAHITPADTFTEYAYFSSYSASWVEHAARFVRRTAEKLALGPDSFVVEVASNDGYLLQHVVAAGIPCLGVEPSRNVSAAATAHGIPTHTAFLDGPTGARLRAEHGPANLVVANNVYAHVPDILGFTEGLRALLADDGWLCIEVHHLLSMIENNQYDTIYHEHFQYYTVASAQRALATGGLTVVDVELLPTHGGSIRLWARPVETAGERQTPAVAEVIEREKAAGLFELSGYAEFAGRVAAIRRDVLRFLIDAAELGKTVVGYGAPGKGNTLLNHCGVRPDLLKYTVDKNPYKHGKYTPGMRIPIVPTERIARDRPDYVFVLPWNLRTEIAAQLSYVARWGGKLVYAIPTLDVVQEFS